MNSNRLNQFFDDLKHKYGTYQDSPSAPEANGSWSPKGDSRSAWRKRLDAWRINFAYELERIGCEQSVEAVTKLYTKHHGTLPPKNLSPGARVAGWVAGTSHPGHTALYRFSQIFGVPGSSLLSSDHIEKRDERVAAVAAIRAKAEADRAKQEADRKSVHAWAKQSPTTSVQQAANAITNHDTVGAQLKAMLADPAKAPYLRMFVVMMTNEMRRGR
jgi:hypothetical protein